MMRTVKIGTALLYLVLLLMCIFALFPFVWMVLTSLKPDAEMFSIPPAWIPTSPTLKHYREVLGGGSFNAYLKNSLIVAIVSTAVAMLISAPAAYGFARFKYRFSGALLGAVVVARMFPPVILLIPFFMLMRSLGLINTKLALIITYMPIQLPLIIWILEGFFREVPQEIEEAAELDGLGTIGTFFKIAVPLSVPAIGVAAVFGFLAAWNEFIFALTLTRTLAAQTMPVGIAGYVTTFQTFWGQMTASASLYTIPVLVFTVVAQKGLIRGLAAGATKG